MRTRRTNHSNGKFSFMIYIRGISAIVSFIWQFHYIFVRFSHITDALSTLWYHMEIRIQFDSNCIMSLVFVWWFQWKLREIQSTWRKIYNRKKWYCVVYSFFVIIFAFVSVDILFFSVIFSQNKRNINIQKMYVDWVRSDLLKQQESYLCWLSIYDISLTWSFQCLFYTSQSCRIIIEL